MTPHICSSAQIYPGINKQELGNHALKLQDNLKLCRSEGPDVAKTSYQLSINKFHIILN
jgi:hypothetical protein